MSKEICFVLDKDKGKKGEILVPEIVKIVVAIMGILILVGLGVKLYGVFLGESDARRAEASLDNLFLKVDQVQKDPSKQLSHFVESPEDYWIIAWPYDGEKEVPSKCLANCVCICPYAYTQSGALTECNQKNGFCKEVSLRVKTFQTTFVGKSNRPIPIGNDFNELQIYSSGGEIFISNSKDLNLNEGDLWDTYTGA